MPLDSLTDSGTPLPTPDVQRTTLSLDVLGRFVCNTFDEATAGGTRDFDAVVIGAGMFGGYCAEKIMRAGKKVLILDAGPFLLPAHTQNLPNLGLFAPDPLTPRDDPHVARNLVWGVPWRSNVPWVGQAYCVGGKSLFWGGWCPRLLPGDLADWPPQAATYLTDHYGTLEHQTGVDTTTDFVSGPLHDLLRARAATAVGVITGIDSVTDAPLAVEGQSPAAGLFAFDKFSSVTLLVEAARDAAVQPDDRRPLFVVPNTHVTRLLTTAGAVTHLEAEVNGTPRTLPLALGCAVVLALGTIESTRLALASFPSRPGNPAAELIGRNLMAHWRTNTFVRIPRHALDPTAILPVALQSGALLVRGSTSDGEFHIQVTASADPSGNADDLLFAMIPDTDQLAATLAARTADTVTIAFRGVSQMVGDRTTAVPNANGRWIDLSPFEVDEFGIPRAWVQMTSTPTEDALRDAMVQAVRDLATHLAGGNPDAVEVLSSGCDGLGTTYHEAGTMWMGSDPTTSVTDSSGRFHHVSNAYCADQSLFVTVGSVNPTLTGLVLARRVAEAVVAAGG